MGGGYGLGDHSVEAGLNGAVFLDRFDLGVSAQIVQVLLGELSSITVDDVEPVSDVAWGGRDAGLGRDNVGSERHILLEGNNIPSRDGFLGFGNGKKGGHCGRVP